jgi:hypothetical protein
MGAMLMLNATQLTKSLREKRIQYAQHPHVFWGIKFAGLNEILKDARHIGYLTSKDLNDYFTALQFAQAQYVLAPIILELNNPNHEYILLNYENPLMAINRAKAIGARPVKINPFGIVLARRNTEQTQ